MIRTQIHLPEEQHEAIRIKAFENRTSMAEEIRKAIAEYLSRNDRDRPSDA